MGYILDKCIEIETKIEEECDKHEECEGCPYKNGNECNIPDVYAGIIDLSTIIPKESYIKLKNIDLSMVPFLKQGDKVIEERKEFTDAVADLKFKLGDNETYLKNHAIEEFWDMVQAGLGLLQKVGIYADEVMAGYQAHLDKMEQRGNKPREKVQK